MERNLNDGYVLITSNATFDFYLKKVRTTWYTHAIYKGTNIEDCMAGYNTKKAAVHGINCWAEWME